MNPQDASPAEVARRVLEWVTEPLGNRTTQAARSMAARTAALAYVYGIGEPTSARRIASKLGITAQHFSLYCRAASREFGGQRAPHFHGHDWRRRF